MKIEIELEEEGIRRIMGICKARDFQEGEVKKELTEILGGE